MKIIVALPDNKYFLWQMLVQISNFRELGIENDVTYVIGKNTVKSSDTLMKIMDSDVKCNFVVFNDTRENPKYSSSLRPHILAKYFESNPDMEKTPFFYIDPDVIFTKKLKFKDIESNEINYLSDTKSYINSNYIKSKSELLFKEMCDIVQINSELVENNDDNAGGAQYLLKNINVDFAWATDPIKKWDTVNIYHNAGAVNDNGTFFIKTKYQISPFNEKLSCSDKYCSYNYLKEIVNTKKNFKDILF